MLRPRGLRVRRPFEDGIPLARAETLQNRSRPVGTEDAAQELAHHRDRAARLQHEVGQPGRLVDPPPDSHAGQRDDGTGQLARQHDAPFPIVVPHAARTLASDELDVVQHRLAIDCLPDVHPPLTRDADRAVAEQVAEQPGERQRAEPLVRAAHGEGHPAGA